MMITKWSGISQSKEMLLSSMQFGFRKRGFFTMALVFLLALLVRAANQPVDYDSDDEYIGGHRQQLRQQLINNRQPVPATGVPVAGTLDQRPSRSDAWSTRMREKYGLDTSEFTYNPSESNRYPQAAPQQTEERSRCTIM